MTVSITCDGCGTAAETSTSYDTEPSDIDRVLEWGWEHDNGEDYCSSCTDDRASARIAMIPDHPERAHENRNER